jgi:glycosyltransferase involved in cell wall biosynthesis
MENVAISIVIPAYNVEKYVRECLDSILRQTFQNYEVILINDGSSDNTLHILREYESVYQDKIRVFDQENGGQSNARNNAFQYVRGKYLTYIDADDYIWDDYLETLYESAEKNNADLVICSYEKFKNDGTIILTRNTKDWEIEFDNGLKHVFQYSPCAKLYSSEMLISNNILFGEGERMEDGPFGIITSSIAKNVVVLDYFGYRYRYYEESTMGGIREKGISDSDEKQQFPYKGIEDAIVKVRRIRGSEYDQVLEYCIIKALAGFQFEFSAKSSLSTVKYISEYSDYIIKTYFPNLKKNPYMHLYRLKKLPLFHRAAVVIFKASYRVGMLYKVAILYQKVLGKR